MFARGAKSLIFTFSNFDPKKDYYKILGIGIDANVGEVKKAFLAMAKIVHPDTHKGD